MGRGMERPAGTGVALSVRPHPLGGSATEDRVARCPGVRPVTPSRDVRGAPVVTVAKLADHRHADTV